MIYTVTFNPAVDYVVHMADMVPGEVNRLTREEIYFGGKGINVSLMLAQLGIPSRALGFVAGFTGEAIAQGVRGAGIQTDFVQLEEGFSRINVKIKSRLETDLNGRGPDIPPEKIEALFRKLDALADGDTLVLAGSIPATLPGDMYEQILSRISAKRVRTVVDATGRLLWNVLPYRPFLIKPNHLELAELFDVEIGGVEDIARYARSLQDMGARNVLVSMAGNGALLLDENGRIHTRGVCRGTVKNSVGAGDSMVAGFLAGCMRDPVPDYDYALKLGTAAGGATVFSEGLGDRATVDALLAQLS